MLKEKIQKSDRLTTNDFDLFALHFKLDEKNMHISKGQFIGLKQTTEMDFSGDLGLGLGSDSQILVSYHDRTGKLSGLLDKYIGGDMIPLKLVGKQFDLTPDYEYTMKQLAAMAIDKNKEKWKEKVKEKISEKVSEKLKEKLGDQVQGTVEKLKDKLLQGEGKDSLKNALKGLFQ
jgi:hypothetical protein